MTELQKEQYMQRAIELAKNAYGYTSPNPMVGCVVVKDKRIISEACHERYGEFHAERNALLSCEEDPEGAELFVTLEPCCHHGKTPPCTDIIIEKKIKKVYVGSLDSNPLVAGKGVRILQDAGIEVECGILEKECIRMNEVFYHYITTKQPFVVLKYAMTLDGKIATKTGDSKWITGERARAHVQELRRRYASILVGIQTVLADDPMLNCRAFEGVNPIRIICDSNLRIPVECQIVNTAKEIPTIVVCSRNAEHTQGKVFADKKMQLEAQGVEVMICGEKQVDIDKLLSILGERKIDSVLVEGGSSIHGSFLASGNVQKVMAYIAPKLVGGQSAGSPVGGNGISFMKDAMHLNNVEITKFDDDILITGYPV